MKPHLKLLVLLVLAIGCFIAGTSKPVAANVAKCCWVCQGNFCVHMCSNEFCGCGSQICPSSPKDVSPSNEHFKPVSFVFEQAERQAMIQEMRKRPAVKQHSRPQLLD